MPLLGDPEAVLAATDDLLRAARGLRDAHEALVHYGRTTTAAWDGTAGALALARIGQDATNVRVAAEAAEQAATPLRSFAEELRRAQQDFAIGEQMVRDAQGGHGSPRFRRRGGS